MLSSDIFKTGQGTAVNQTKKVPWGGNFNTISYAGINYFFVEQVFNPTIEYSGQKLTRLVSRNTPPRITRISPGVPATVPLKYR